jgi:sugar phosphate isomerase/epimerase
MDFACHTWNFHDLTLPEALGTIARLGFRCVDIAPSPAKAAANPRRMADELLDDLNTYQLRVTDLLILLPRISLADWQEKDVEMFTALLPLANALRAPGLTVSPGVQQEDAFERVVEALTAMVAAGKAAGLRVSIEAQPDSMAQTPDAALKLLDAVPGLELTLDWANLVYMKAPHEAIAALLPRTRHVQVRQAAPGKLQTPFEQGKIDLGRVIEALIAAGYGGAVCVELVNAAGRHGIIPVPPARESARLRDTLRALYRSKAPKETG